MGLPLIYRKRYMPNETVLLKDDEILHLDEDTLVTKWRVLRPKALFSHGISCYFLKKGYKISKFLNENEELVYYYCDIIDTEFDETQNAFTFTDLLADVILYGDGFVKVVDLAEIADAMESGSISLPEVRSALRRLDALLEIIYSGKFPELLRFIEKEDMTDEREYS